MKLYYVPRTRAGRVRWMLEELGVPYELERLDVAARQNKTPEYLRVHPLGKVPALTDGGTSLFESAAIIAWLADRYPDRGLAPAPDADERGLYYQWLFYGPVSVEPELQAYANLNRLPEDQRDPVALGEAKRAALERLAPIARALDGKTFLLGERLSAADIVLGGIVTWARSLGLLEDLPVLTAYAARLGDRPASRRARAD